jgi:hypothetical protein
MSPPVLQLPLDLSGEAATNKVVAELHIVAATGTRAFVTTRGPFYTKNLVVRNKTTGVELVPDVDWRPVHMFLEASLRAGDEICSVILILPTCNATEIETDYQAIGGEYSTSVSSIEQLLDSLDLDNRTVNWGDLIGAPEYFPPTAHLHDVGDVYGFEYLVAVLEQIRRAILLGDQAAFDELRNYVNLQDNALRGLITSLESLMTDHVSNTNNPHQTTKAHVGLGNVLNYGVATTADAQAGVANNLYMTPLRVKEAITSQVGNAFAAHVANINNPHGVTKTQVGLSNVDNFPTATLAEAQSGTPAGRFMTTQRVKEAIDFQALTPLNAHIARTDNPHNTSKTHVGLGNVDNYATATNAQAIAGTATNLFMTPANTRALIDSAVGNGLSSHIARTDNPHSVTKAQVGLSSVENYKQVRNIGANQLQMQWINSQIEAVVDSTNMGRVHTTLQPDPNIAAHANRTDNPHGVDKADVGLGNVFNYGVSDQASAEAGTSNILYMSPLRTKQAITAQAVTPLMALINNKINTNGDGVLNTLQLGGLPNKAYLYQEADGSLSTRVAANNVDPQFKYFTFNSDGSFYVGNGRVVAAGGFQPSDKRLKKGIVKFDPRPLWRMLDYKQYTMIESGELQTGVLAQKMQEVAPDRVFEYEHGTGRRKCKRLSVDYIGAGFEMAMAAGKEIDALTEQVALLEQANAAQRDLIAALAARLDALEAKA